MVVVHSPDSDGRRPRSSASSLHGRARRCAPSERVTDGRRPAAGHVDLARRPHRDRPGRRGGERQRHGARRRRPQGRAGRHQRRRRRRSRSPAPPACGRTSTRPTRRAMMKSELISLAGHAGHPRARLRLAGRRRAAADAHDPRPGRRRPARCTSAPQVLDISIWAMNFALMFALALGIDYALFIVYRFRGAFFGSKPERPRTRSAETMDTAGKAVLFSGVTVLISLSAVMLVPCPAFRSMALGIMLSVVFILAATLTLLPAVLAQARPARGQARRCQWVHSGEHRSPRFAAWAERLWRRPVRLRRRRASSRSSRSPCRCSGLQTGMPSIKVVPERRRLARRLHAGPAGVRPGRARARCRSSRRRPTPRRSPHVARRRPRHRPGHAADARLRRPAALVQAIPRHDPSDKAVGATDRPPARRACRRARWSAGRSPRTTTSRRRSPSKTPLVIGVVLGARLPAAARRAAGADHRRRRRAHQPARHRRRVRRRPADLPGRPPRRPARLRVPGLPGRLGAGVLLRDDLRDLDGLHGVPALQRQGALGPQPRPEGGDGRRRRPLRPRRSSPPPR